MAVKHTWLAHLVATHMGCIFHCNVSRPRRIKTWLCTYNDIIILSASKLSGRMTPMVLSMDSNSGDLLSQPMRHRPQIATGGARQRVVPHLVDSPDDPRGKRIKTSKHDNGCSLCTSLFSQRGLEHVNSATGFIHATQEQCVDSSAEGCDMCAFILFLVSKNHHVCWTDDDPLIFRNVRAVPSGRTDTRPRTGGIYGLHGSFASNPHDPVISIHTFAEKGKSQVLFGDIRSKCDLIGL